MTQEQYLPEIRLRALEPEDLDALYHIENDASMWCIGPTNVPYSRYMLHDYIAHNTADIYADRQLRLIIENADHETVGIADLANFDPRHQRAEVGLVIQQPFRRQGYARVALRHIHDYARETIHLHQLYAIIDSTNTTAIKLFLQLGYEQTASLNDWLYDGKNYRGATVMQIIL